MTHYEEFCSFQFSSNILPFLRTDPIHIKSEFSIFHNVNSVQSIVLYSHIWSFQATLFLFVYFEFFCIFYFPTNHIKVNQWECVVSVRCIEVQYKILYFYLVGWGNFFVLYIIILSANFSLIWLCLLP